MLPFGTHSFEHPEVVMVGELRLVPTTLDRLCVDHAIPPPDLLVVDVQGALVVDVQGAELAVLRGGANLMRRTALAYLGVNEAALYDGGNLASGTR